MGERNLVAVFFSVGNGQRGYGDVQTLCLVDFGFCYGFGFFILL